MLSNLWPFNSASTIPPCTRIEFAFQFWPRFARDVSDSSQLVHPTIISKNCPNSSFNKGIYSFRSYVDQIDVGKCIR